MKKNKFIEATEGGEAAAGGGGAMVSSDGESTEEGEMSDDEIGSVQEVLSSETDGESEDGLLLESEDEDEDEDGELRGADDVVATGPGQDADGTAKEPVRRSRTDLEGDDVSISASEADESDDSEGMRVPFVDLPTHTNTHTQNTRTIPCRISDTRARNVPPI